MAEIFAFTTIVSLPLGYDCTVPLPVEQIAERLTADTIDANVLIEIRAVREGGSFLSCDELLQFRNGKLQSEMPTQFYVPDQVDAKAEHPAYLEMAVSSADKQRIFSSKSVFGVYSIYTKPGKKSFFSDNAYKFGSPPVISQMALFRRYVDAYPLIHMDRRRDLGETIVCINSYLRPILAEIRTHDRRSIPRVRIPPMSARNIDLSQLLYEEEESWAGHIQLTANNRLITFNIKRSLANPLLISDHEHLDPYRADPAFLPATQALRIAIGKFARNARTHLFG